MTSFVGHIYKRCVSRADDFIAEEPEFASAMLCYYKDVIACMGALQFVPSFMKSYDLVLIMVPYLLNC